MSVRQTDVIRCSKEGPIVLKREDFVFCIGYQGDAAVVDGRAKKEYKGWGARRLLEKGLFRAAFSAAVYDGSDEELQLVIDAYAEQIGSEIPDQEAMKRLLGIFSVPDEINKVMIV